MEIKTYLPMILRYVVVYLASVLSTRGLINGDQSSFLSGQTDAIVGALIALGAVAWGIYKRPSAKAMTVAKAVDKEVPANVDVVVKTPAGIPDVFVPAKRE